MNPDDLQAQATEQTGLDDFGDPSYREGLERYCDALDNEAQLNELGNVALPPSLVAALANRLKVVDWAKQHPEVTEERIEAPIVVIGMFRAGTTFLSNLLDVDPANRALLRLGVAGLRAAAAAGRAQDRPAGRRGPGRRRHARDAQPRDQRDPPRGRRRPDRVHRGDGPGVPEHLLGGDRQRAVVRRVVARRRQPRRLRLPPPRAADPAERRRPRPLDAQEPAPRARPRGADDTYPDARLVLLHRDPVTLTGSVCSLINVMSSTFSDADHRAYIAEHWSDMLEESIRRIEDFRARRPEHPILDVQYADLVRDPVGTVRGIYDALGLEAGDGAFERDGRHLAAHPQGEFGGHRYDVTEFGLDRGRRTRAVPRLHRALRRRG